MNENTYFRGKATGHKDMWVYGHLVQGDVLDKRYYIRTYGKESESPKWVEYQVDEKTIGRSTGKSCKNEKGEDVFLFEDDIIMSDYGVARIYWCSFFLGWRYEFNLDSDQLGTLHSHYIKLLGNYHDTPQLIKETLV